MEALKEFLRFWVAFSVVDEDGVGSVSVGDLKASGLSRWYRTRRGSMVSGFRVLRRTHQRSRARAEFQVSCFPRSSPWGGGPLAAVD